MSFLWEHRHFTLIASTLWFIWLLRILSNFQTTCHQSSNHSYKVFWTRHQMRDLHGLNYCSIHLFLKLSKRKEIEKLELNFITTGLQVNIIMVVDNKTLRFLKFKIQRVLIQWLVRHQLIMIRKTMLNALILIFLNLIFQAIHSLPKILMTLQGCLMRFGKNTKNSQLM